VQKLLNFLIGGRTFVLKHITIDVKLPNIYLICNRIVRTIEILSFEPNIMKMQRIQVNLITWFYTHAHILLTVAEVIIS
jgi:hypothetical protein